MSTDAVKDEAKIIDESKYLSRDLSWLEFNSRVLEQAKKSSRTVWEKLKFMAITDSNLDEFLEIRVGSLYNYLDFGKKRIDYCGLREVPFKKLLFKKIKAFVNDQQSHFTTKLEAEMHKNGFEITRASELSPKSLKKAKRYFSHTVFPMLTPMIYDQFHPFPVLRNKVLVLGVATESGNKKDPVKYSFVQIPKNIPRFFEVEEDGKLIFVPIESIIHDNVDKLYKNVTVIGKGLFRITRNGDFDYDDYDESEVDFVQEIQKKLKKRKTGRVVRLELMEGAGKGLEEVLRDKFELESDNVFKIRSLLDYGGLWQIIGHKNFQDRIPELPTPVTPVSASEAVGESLLDYLIDHEIMLHHPYNSMDPVIRMLDEAAEDPEVLAIKITIYRLADDSQITDALLKAAENGKHVSVLFEVKARFDEENNIKEGQKLQRAGCFVAYGIREVKTHTKLLLIVRQRKNNIVSYTHMSSGNYNEDTARIYSDTSVLTSKRVYGNDISEFFNVITGHSHPVNYKRLITTPGDMRKKIISLIRKESNNSKKGLPAGIIIKVNSLEDRFVIDELYKASQAGVKIHLIVRGICCLRPGRKGLSDNITVKSIVGEFLEHSRLYYFHNQGDFKIYGGSADIMVRSFDRRIESLFLMEDLARMEALNILSFNLKDQVNSFRLKEDGKSVHVKQTPKSFDIHKEFYNVTLDQVEKAKIRF